MTCNYICGGCSINIPSIESMQGNEKKSCPQCGYSLFMIVKDDFGLSRYSDLKDLNSKQQEIISYIKMCINEQNSFPTAEGIKKHLNLKSVSTVYYHLNTLKSKGYITFKQGQLHTIKLLPKIISEESLLSLSEKQLDLLNIINNYIEEFKKSPTTQELKVAIDVSSIATLVYHLDKLYSLNLISKNRYQHRSITLTEKGLNLLNVIKKESS